MTNSINKVLIGSPVHQKPAILREFLSSILRLHKTGFSVDLLFIDDNDDEEASSLLRDFSRSALNTTIMPSGFKDFYLRDEHTHHWTSNLVWKVAHMKDKIINYAQEQNYDYLFLIDSDLVLHPKTLEQLLAANKDIISEIFWTRWQPHSLPLPQVWMHDEYNQWEARPEETLTENEKQDRFQQFLEKMRIPGVYQVGGLGACTLLSSEAMTKGISFQPLHNLSFWGEDRHFCIRAAALGLELYVDTHFPAFHIYRDTDLVHVKNYNLQSSASGHQDILPSNLDVNLLPRCRANRPKLTLSITVRNEENRFLKQALLSHLQYIDEAVIIDDGSTDRTAAICTEILKGIPYRIIHNSQSKFRNEIELRKQQWNEVISTNPEWILVLDADEIFEPRFVHEVDQLLMAEDVDLYCFRLYDFWNETDYREDQYWHSHLTYRPFLIRYKTDLSYEWIDTPQHCGRFPSNVFALSHQLSDLRLKHLGWSKPEYRQEKYIRYLTLDPEGIYGWKEQYLSILDERPKLIRWED